MAVWFRRSGCECDQATKRWNKYPPLRLRGEGGNPSPGFRSRLLALCYTIPSSVSGGGASSTQGAKYPPSSCHDLHIITARTNILYSVHRPVSPAPRVLILFGFPSILLITSSPSSEELHVLYRSRFPPRPCPQPLFPSCDLDNPLRPYMPRVLLG
jgi:hypothetical protein